MIIEMEVTCPRKEDSFCPTDCPLYQLSEKMAVGALTIFPEDYAKETSGSTNILASRLDITDEEIEDAKNNCAIEAKERQEHPEVLN